jgi:hypothetical protein
VLRTEVFKERYGWSSPADIINPSQPGISQDTDNGRPGARLRYSSTRWIAKSQFAAWLIELRLEIRAQIQICTQWIVLASRTTWRGRNRFLGRHW